MLRISKKPMFVIFLIYSAIIIYLMFFAFSRDQLQTGDALYYEFTINQLPLYLPKSLDAESIATWSFSAGNLLLFIPFGIFIPALLNTKFLKTIIIFIISITCIEILQMITHLGVFDVKDIIINTLGCIIGYTCYRFSNYNENYDVIKVLSMAFTMVVILTFIINYINKAIL